MTPSAFPSFKGSDGFDDPDEIHDDEELNLLDYTNPGQNQTQAREQQQQITVPHNQTHCLAQPSRSLSPSSSDMPNHVTGPNQEQAQLLMPFQGPFQNTSPRHERPAHQSDAQSVLNYRQEMNRKLQSQVNAKKPQRSLAGMGLQTEQPELQPQKPKLQPEETVEPEPCADDQTSDSEFQHLLQMLHSQYSTENMPPLSLVPELAHPPPQLQRVELDTANSEVIDIDEIQQNAPPFHPKHHRPKRRNSLPTGENPAKRQRVPKRRPLHSNRSLQFGSPSNVCSSNEFKITRSDPQVKCMSCNSRFPDWHAVRRHFRMVHANERQSTTCHECLIKYACKTNLQLHWDNAHEGELNFICDACGARFCKKRYLTMHRTKVHSGEPKPDWKITKIHKCKICNFSSDQKLDVITHLFAAHDDAVNVDCPGGCGGRFQSMADARAHYFNCTDRS